MSTAEMPCYNCGLTLSRLHAISSGEALLSESELLRQLRYYGWMTGNPGSLIKHYHKEAA